MKKLIIFLLILSLFSFATYSFVISINSLGKNSIGNDIQAPLEIANSSYYKINKISYNTENIDMKYPQITNMSETGKQKRINDLIKNDAFTLLDYYNETETGIDIDYSIKLNNQNLLSIQYIGGRYVKGAAYPNNFLYSTNIDINKEKKIKLTDIVEINDTFVKRYKDGKYNPWDEGLNSAISYIKNDINSNNLVNEFKYADTLDNDNTAYAFSYFTKDSLGISVGVAHAIGDHAEFEIKYSDINDLIKHDSILYKLTH